MLIINEAEGKIGKRPSERPIGELLEYGIAVIDKPPGPSSHEVSAFARKILSLKATGHTGTLDQNVSGVLVVLLGSSRKMAGYLSKADKKYVCVMRLSKPTSNAQLECALDNFRGEIYQKPPLQSAVAKKLRIRKIHSLNVLEIRENLALFECACEAGTYIRKLVFDIGEILGIKAEMAELRRVRAGQFDEKQAVSLQELADHYWAWKEKGDDSYIRRTIFPIETLKMKKIVLTDASAQKIRNGIRPKISDVMALDENIDSLDVVGLFTLNGELIAAARSLMPSHEVKLKHASDEDALPVAAIERVIHEF
ncbi:MAG: RNA-guided pseudouridylation complex pseudouridine synthase subunit Cbf5 [Candidatus Micrarchaeota archaeon]